MDGKKQLFTLLTRNRKSVLFTKTYSETISRNLLNKLKKSSYEGDKKLYELIIKSKNSDIVNDKNESNREITTPVVIPRIKEPSNISTTLHSVWRPFMLCQADLADFEFTNPNATEPHYVLTCVDLFTQKTYTYPMPSKKNLDK